MDSILITGAASGIGLATARRFHTNGWRVGLLDVNEGALQAVHAELGERCWYRRLDVTDMGQCEAAVAAFAESAGGRLDVLFNSAGVLRMGHFEDLSAEQHRFTLDVNVAGTLQMCLAALPYLKQSRSPRVLNMSSASALYGVPHLASYSASKFAVRGLTEALDLEWRRHGIRVQDLMPPFVNTGMVNKQTFEAPVVRRMGVRHPAGRPPGACAGGAAAPLHGAAGEGRAATGHARLNGLAEPRLVADFHFAAAPLQGRLPVLAQVDVDLVAPAGVHLVAHVPGALQAFDFHRGAVIQAGGEQVPGHGDGFHARHQGVAPGRQTVILAMPLPGQGVKGGGGDRAPLGKLLRERRARQQHPEKHPPGIHEALPILFRCPH